MSPINKPMPNKLVSELSAQVRGIENSLKKHLDEGVEIKLKLERLSADQMWLKVVGLIILTAIAGLYLKK